ncbi:MAG: hypothetical protein RI571_15140 [Roseovarius sp.]|nr:hypothetical protein [Roseovarius sp.]
MKHATTQGNSVSRDFEARHYAPRAVAEHFDISMNTVWRWVKRGILPEPQKLSPGCSRFWGPDINAKLAQKEPA